MYDYGIGNVDLNWLECITKCEFS